MDFPLILAALLFYFKLLPLFVEFNYAKILTGEPIMTMLIKDPRLEENLIEARKRTDADRWDEVWDGVYVVSPLPNIEHQEIVYQGGQKGVICV